LRISGWLFVALLAAVFAPAVLALSEAWSRLDYYSHGYLVPVAALSAAAARRGLLLRLPAERDRRGLLGLALALALDLLGTAGSLLWLQGLAVVLAVASAVLYLRGLAWLRALVFPVAFLVFMVPLPDAVVTPVIGGLQLFVSTAAVGLLHGVGVAVLREGNVILLPGGESLFVAEACSGITSVLTLLSLSVLFAYFSERSLARRAVLVAFVVPVALVANLLRVVGTVLASRAFGVEAVIRASVHDVAGVFVYVLACLALIGVGRLMRRMKPAESGRSPESAVR